MNKLYQIKHELWLDILYASFAIENREIKDRLYDSAMIAFRHMKWLGGDILEAGIDVIRFSIDGFSEQTFSQSRVGVNYEHTVDRTLKFIRLAKKKGGARRIEVRMIDLDINRREHAAYKKFWADAGAIPIITSFYRWPWEPGVECVRLPCLKVLREMFFYVNGKATICCWDSHERAVIGDVTKQHVLDIWNGAINQKYRLTLAEGRRDEILLCSRCEAYKDLEFEGFSSVGQT